MPIAFTEFEAVINVKKDASVALPVNKSAIAMTTSILHGYATPATILKMK
jgi:hypothetical protein